MSVKILLSSLQELGVRLSIENNKLFIHGKKEVLSEDLLNKIKESKELLLDFLKRNEQHSDFSVADQEIIKLERFKNNESSHDFPASSSQKRLWVIHNLSSIKTAYNVSTFFKIEGDVSCDLLQQSVNKIVSRHESLRTLFLYDNGDVKQRIINDSLAKITIEKIALDEKNRNEVSHKIKNICKKITSQEFDLGTYPLFKVSLIEAKSFNYFILVMVFHHIICDARSIDIFLHELSENYNSLKNGIVSTLEDISYQYVDYSWLQNKDIEYYLPEKIKFWKEHLNGYENLNLPLDKNRPRELSYKGNALPEKISSLTCLSLKDIVKELKTSLFVVLFSVFGLVLSRYSNQEDLVVGIPVTGRNRNEFENTIGFFVNTIAVRLKITKSEIFKVLIKNIHETFMTCHEYQDVPFEKVVEALDPNREQSVSPLFQVMFVMQNHGDHNLKLDNANVEEYSVSYDNSKFDLTLFALDKENEIELSLEYNSDIFLEETIKRILDSIVQVTNNLISNVNKDVGVIEVYNNEKLQAYIFGKNYGKNSPIKTISVIELLRPLFISASDKIAIYTDNDSITYKQLNAKINVFYNCLIKKNIKCHDVIAICMDPTINFVVALLATIKLGAVYLPVDPMTPGKRKEFILKDSNAKAFVVDSPSFIPNIEGCIVITANDYLNGNLECNKAGFENINLSSENTCYIIYTSGSTGNPKGVPIKHGGLVNYLQWARQYYCNSEPSNTLIFTSFAFDLTLTSLFLPLITGGFIRLVHDRLKFIDYLAKTEKYTFLKLTPSHLRVINKTFSKKEITKIAQMLIVGGEALYQEDIKPWLSASNNVRIINEYGPTETVVGCVYYECSNNGNGIVPIGRPIDNMYIYVLDNEMKPVSPGMIGELYIGGVALSAGYLNLNELNESVFVSDPYHNNQKIYKTGDLVKWQEDGNVIYLGRVGDQIKYNGYRIELAEIEAAILENIEIKQAAVIFDKEIIGYIVPPNNEFNVNDLIGNLRQTLPEYMIPKRFITVDNIPLTVNGKVNISKLKKYDVHKTETAIVPPKGNVQIKLCNIWSSVLQIEKDKISILDDFYSIGGNSLKSIQVVFLGKKSGIFIEPADLLKYRNIELLAKNHESSQVSDHEKINKTEINNGIIVKLLKTDEKKQPLFCVHPGGGSVECYLNLANYLRSSFEVYAVRDPTIEEAEIKLLSIEETALHYLQHIEIMDLDYPYILAGWSYGGTVAYEMAQQLTKKGCKVAGVLLFDSWLWNDCDYEYAPKDIDEFMSDLNVAKNDLPEHVIKRMYHSMLQKFKNLKNYQPQQPAFPTNLFKSKIILPNTPYDKYMSPYNRWDKVICSNFSIFHVNGYHEQLMDNPYVKELANQILTTKITEL